jgi:hypothetical protein
MNTNNINPGQAYKMIKVIYYSLVAGLAAFLALVLYVADEKFFFKTDLSDPLILSGIFIGCITLPAGYYIAKATFQKIDQNESLKSKLLKYQSGQLIRLSTCEGIGMYSIVCFLLTPNLFFLIFLLIPVAFMFSYFPSPDKIGLEINLSESEIALLMEL